MVYHNSESFLVVVVNFKTHVDPLLMELTESVLGKCDESFFQRGWGTKVPR